MSPVVESRRWWSEIHNYESGNQQQLAEALDAILCDAAAPAKSSDDRVHIDETSTVGGSSDYTTLPPAFILLLLLCVLLSGPKLLRYAIATAILLYILSVAQTQSAGGSGLDRRDSSSIIGSDGGVTASETALFSRVDDWLASVFSDGTTYTDQTAVDSPPDFEGIFDGRSSVAKVFLDGEEVTVFSGLWADAVVIFGKEPAPVVTIIDEKPVETIPSHSVNEVGIIVNQQPEIAAVDETETENQAPAALPAYDSKEDSKDLTGLLEELFPEEDDENDIFWKPVKYEGLKMTDTTAEQPETGLDDAQYIVHHSPQHDESTPVYHSSHLSDDQARIGHDPVTSPSSYGSDGQACIESDIIASHPSPPSEPFSDHPSYIDSDAAASPPPEDEPQTLPQSEYLLSDPPTSTAVQPQQEVIYQPIQQPADPQYQTFHFNYIPKPMTKEEMYPDGLQFWQKPKVWWVWNWPPRCRIYGNEEDTDLRCIRVRSLLPRDSTSAVKYHPCCPVQQKLLTRDPQPGGPLKQKKPASGLNWGTLASELPDQPVDEWH